MLPMLATLSMLPLLHMLPLPSFYYASLATCPASGASAAYATCPANISLSSLSLEHAYPAFAASIIYLTYLLTLLTYLVLMIPVIITTHTNYTTLYKFSTGPLFNSCAALVQSMSGTNRYYQRYSLCNILRGGKTSTVCNTCSTYPIVTIRPCIESSK